MSVWYNKKVHMFSKQGCFQHWSLNYRAKLQRNMGCFQLHPFLFCEHSFSYTMSLRPLCLIASKGAFCKQYFTFPPNSLSKIHTYIITVGCHPMRQRTHRSNASHPTTKKDARGCEVIQKTKQGETKRINTCFLLNKRPESFSNCREHPKH